MHLNKSHKRVSAVFTRDELRLLRQAGQSGIPKNKEIVLTLTESGTLVDTMPPGLDEGVIDLLLDRVRSRLS